MSLKNGKGYFFLSGITEFVVIMYCIFKKQCENVNTLRTCIKKKDN